MATDLSFYRLQSCASNAVAKFSQTPLRWYYTDIEETRESLEGIIESVRIKGVSVLSGSFYFALYICVGHGCIAIVGRSMLVLFLTI